GRRGLRPWCLGSFAAGASAPAGSCRAGAYAAAGPSGRPIPPGARPSSARRGVLLRDGVPVHDVPPRLDVVGTAVLVVQVVGVLPDVEAEDRGVAVHDRRVLVGRRVALQLAAAIDDQPGPAGAEAAGGLLLEPLLELLEAAEGAVDRLAQLAAGLTAAVRAHDLPEEVVVDVPAAVVADGRAGLLGDGVQIAEELLGALALQLGVLLDRRVEVVRVGGVVLAVVNLHRPRVDVRLEGVLGVRQV